MKFVVSKTVHTFIFEKKEEEEFHFWHLITKLNDSTRQNLGENTD